MPTADIIRSKGQLKVGEMETMRIIVDGFTHHNRQLKVIHPEAPGRFLTAYVRDPAFDESPNIYTEAATERRQLIVNAKAARRKEDDRLQSIYILDATFEEQPS